MEVRVAPQNYSVFLRRSIDHTGSQEFCKRQDAHHGLHSRLLNLQPSPHSLKGTAQTPRTRTCISSISQTTTTSCQPLAINHQECHNSPMPLFNESFPDGHPATHRTADQTHTQLVKVPIVPQNRSILSRTSLAPNNNQEFCKNQIVAHPSPNRLVNLQPNR